MADDSDDDGQQDPFETLDAETDVDRGGDPFDRLENDPGPDARDGQADDQSGTQRPTDQSGTQRPTDPSSQFGGRDSSTDVEAGRSGRDGTSEPFEGAFSRRREDDSVQRDERHGKETEPFDSGASEFEQVDVGGVDSDDVWERLIHTGEGSRAVDADEEVVVSKHDYCETCQYFSAPPDASCTHEGTTILEFVGMDDVRVFNCPVVAERRHLEGEE